MQTSQIEACYWVVAERLTSVILSAYVLYLSGCTFEYDCVLFGILNEIKDFNSV